MDRIITAFILGLSLDRFFICPFLMFGMALSKREAAVRFLLGRMLGIIFFGILVTSIGLKSFPVSGGALNIVFGSLIIILGAAGFFRKPGKGHGKFDGSGGFGLGLFRGMLNPGRKMLIVIPLLIGVSVLKGVAITIVYALSSSFYLVLGVLGGEYLNKVFPYRRGIKIAGAVMLIMLGLFYIIKGVLK